MIENSAELGKYFLERLQAIDNPKIHEVRGLGLWIGLELTEAAGGARQYCEALEKKGLLSSRIDESTKPETGRVRRYFELTPEAMAELRNATLTIIRRDGRKPRPAREAFAAQPWAAIKKVTTV